MHKANNDRISQKVIVWGASSDMGHLLCERLHTQGFDVTAVEAKDFIGDFEKIKIISLSEAQVYLDENDMDLSIFIERAMPDSDDTELSHLEASLELSWNVIQLSYENFYRQRDGELIFISSCSKDSLWGYRNIQGIESLWKERFLKIDSRIKHLSFHENELSDLDSLENTAQRIEESLGRSVNIFSLLKKQISTILRMLKKIKA